MTRMEFISGWPSVHRCRVMRSLPSLHALQSMAQSLCNLVSDPSFLPHYAAHSKLQERNIY